MNWHKYAVATTLSVALTGLGACADNSKKYRDNSELEQPPQLPIVVTPLEQTANSKPNDAKTLADAVSIADDSHLLINLPFDLAWRLIGTAVGLSGMEVSDKNREKGQYYLLFDPDSADQKSGKEANLFSDLFATNNYPKGRYLLTFYENPRSVKIKVEFLESTESDHSAQDGYAERTASDNGVEKLLKKLYTTLHDDLPAN